jgi:hypothetical protein
MTRIDRDKLKRTRHIERDASDFTKLLPISIAVIPAISLLLSISYHIGYYSYFSLQFLIFYTIQDLLANAMFWLPIAVISFTASLVGGFLITDLLVMKKLPRTTIEKRKYLRKHRNTTELVLRVSLLGFLLFTILFARSAIPSVTAFVLTVLILTFGIKHPPAKFSGGEAEKIYVFSLIAISIILSIGYFGRVVAAVDVFSSKNFYTLTLSSGELERIKLSGSVRDGLIYVSNRRTIMFSRFDNIKTIEAQGADFGNDQTGVLCTIGIIDCAVE